MDNTLSKPVGVNRNVLIYKQAVVKNFSFLKQTTRFDDLLVKSIPLTNGEGFLVPVCELHIQDQPLIEKLTRWRQENTFAYPTQFSVTTEGTASWLRERLLDVDDRLLFLVLDRYGVPMGHVGCAHAINDSKEIEIDNIIRGEKDVQPGIMSLAMRALINWAEEMLRPKRLFLRVFSDNDHAINFYHKLGFKEDYLIPLRKQVDGDKVFYYSIDEGDSVVPDRQFLRMFYAPERTVNKEELILTAGPSISAREISYAHDAARNGWNTQHSWYIKRFEAAFADYIGTKYALATSSCTGALHLALMSLGIGPGDEVIVPDITWVATANAVMYVGAVPIFADVEPDSWCLDPHSLESVITKRTRAVMPVHLYGHPARMDRIMEIAGKYNLYVIEDAAPAIGAEFKNRKTGTFGDFAAFSFQGAKLVVTGEGGMLVTDKEELYNKVYTLWDQGRVPGTFWIKETGLKYKMSNIQAAIGLGQLERVDELIEAKRSVFHWYAQRLADVPHINLNRELPWARSIYWMTSIFLDKDAGFIRDDFCKELKKRNIDTRPVFPAISQYPIWPKPQQAQPTARLIGEQAVNLPSGVCLKEEQVDYICHCIKDLLS